MRQPVATPHGPEAESWLVLVHVEVESADTVAPLRRRVFEYYEPLRRRYDLPVLPVAVYLRVGLDGVGWDVYEEHFWEHRLVRFEYPYVGLPALDAEQYLRGDNWLGVALTALMRVPAERRLQLGQEAWRRLVQCQESVRRRYLLCECVAAYLPQNPEQRQELKEILLRGPEPGVLGMMTIFDEIQMEWLQKGQREMLQTMLEKKFGSLSETARQRLASVPPDKLTEMAVAVMSASSLRDLGLEE